jgi:hypothetical protein
MENFPQESDTVVSWDQFHFSCLNFYFKEVK